MVLCQLFDRIGGRRYGGEDIKGRYVPKPKKKAEMYHNVELFVDMVSKLGVDQIFHPPDLVEPKDEESIDPNVVVCINQYAR